MQSFMKIELDVCSLLGFVCVCERERERERERCSRLLLGKKKNILLNSFKCLDYLLWVRFLVQCFG